MAGVRRHRHSIVGLYTDVSKHATRRSCTLSKQSIGIFFPGQFTLPCFISTIRPTDFFISFMLKADINQRGK